MDEMLNKLENELVVLPSAPKELLSLNPQINSILGHNKTVRRLSCLKGLLVTKRIPMNTDSGELSTVDQVESKKISHGCMFIPAPLSDKVIILKTVTHLSTDEAVTQITHSISDQLQCLDRTVEQILAKTKVSKFNVQLFVCHSGRVQNSPEFERLKLNCVDLENEPRFVNFNVAIDFTDDKELNEKILTCVERGTAKSDVIPKLILHCDATLEQCFYQLSAQPLKLLSSEPATFEQIDKLIELFDFYFPDRHKKLLSIPHFNRIEDHMLNAYTPEGKLGNFADYAGYLGEVRLVSEKLLANLENPRGILLKNYSNQHLETILNREHFVPQQFEIDWLYLGQNQIIAIEVGMSEEPQKPRTCIRNKIDQMIEKILPQMQLILYSFGKSYHKGEKEHLGNFSINSVESLHKVIVFLPEVDCATLTNEIKRICQSGQSSSKKKKMTSEQAADQKRKNMLQQNGQFLNIIFFLVEDRSSKNQLRFLHLSEDLQVMPTKGSIQDIFNNSLPGVENQLFSYICTLFSFSRLNCIGNLEIESIDGEALEVDQRFLQPLAKGTERDATFPAMILSPQQHRILSDLNKTHLIITGHPGTGKTILLLSKCEQLAADDSVKKIIFIYGEYREQFRKYLERICNSCWSTETRNKTIFEEGIVGSYGLDKFLKVIQNVVNLLCKRMTDRQS